MTMYLPLWTMQHNAIPGSSASPTSWRCNSGCHDEDIYKVVHTPWDVVETKENGINYSPICYSHTAKHHTPTLFFFAIWTQLWPSWKGTTELNERWMNSQWQHRKSVVNYVLKIWDWLNNMSELVKEKAWYVQNAWQQTFKEREQVLVLLPTTSDKLTTQWQEPYTIIESVSSLWQDWHGW